MEIIEGYRGRAGSSTMLRRARGGGRAYRVNRGVLPVWRTGSTRTRAYVTTLYVVFFISVHALPAAHWLVFKEIVFFFFLFPLRIIIWTGIIYVPTVRILLTGWLPRYNGRFSLERTPCWVYVSRFLSWVENPISKV